MYYLALLENEEGNQKHITTCNKEKFLSEFKELETLGYHMTNIIRTTNKAFYCKTRCEVYVQELKDLEQKRRDYVMLLEENDSDREVITDAERLYGELENILVNKVGMAYSRFLSNKGEYEYEDELAVACYTFRKSRMMLDDLLAKATYTGWDC